MATRTREIGIRLALGEERRSIPGMVIRDAARLVATGAILGILASAAAGRAFSAALYGVGSMDPIIIATPIVIPGSVALLAALAPARKASGIDPLLALRQE